MREFLLRTKKAEGQLLENLKLDKSVKLILQLLADNLATMVVNRLDECAPQRRQDLIFVLQRLLKKSKIVLKVFVSSRNNDDMVH